MRGTLDILWSCLFTIFACTWTIQHLNVPEQRHGRDKSKLGCIKWLLKGPLNSTKWMLITAFAPELILGKAWSDLSAARKNKRRMQEWAEKDGVEWELSHSFFANMGGFVAIPQDRVKFPTTVSSGGPTDGPSEAQEGPHEKQPEYTERSDIRKTIPLVLLGETMLEMREKEYIKSLPDISHDELSDKSKGNVFAKTIAISQVSWNTVQIVARVAKGLTVTQLELAVTAFSFCAVITYLLLLKKPQGVQVPARPVNCTQAVHYDLDYARPLSCEEWILRSNQKKSYRYVPALTPWHVSRPRDHISNDLIEGNSDGEFLAGIVIGNVVFGAIHVAGWNLVFHNNIEQLLWRIASLYITALPLVLYIFSLAFTIYFLYVKRCSLEGYFTDRIVPVLLASTYITARLFLVVEYFRTLLFLPPDAYISTWASNIPHVA